MCLLEQEPKHDIKTICRDCVFAVYENFGGDNGYSYQHGCKLDRIEKFEQNGAQISQVEDTAQKKVYLSINGRVCNACRNQSWAKHQKGNLLKAVRKEIRFKPDVIIDGCDATLEGIYHTAGSVVNLAVLPKSVIVAIKNPGYVVKIIQKFRDELFKGVDIDWSIEHITDEGAEVVTKAARRCMSPYFMAVNAGWRIDSSYTLNMEKYINEEMRRFIMIIPSPENQIYVFNTSLFRSIGGNKDRRAVDKIQQLADEQENHHMIKTMEEICQTFQ